MVIPPFDYLTIGVALRISLAMILELGSYIVTLLCQNQGGGYLHLVAVGLDP
jgi:hypothetical protein